MSQSALCRVCGQRTVWGELEDRSDKAHALQTEPLAHGRRRCQEAHSGCDVARTLEENLRTDMEKMGPREEHNGTNIQQRQTLRTTIWACPLPRRWA